MGDDVEVGLEFEFEMELEFVFELELEFEFELDVTSGLFSLARTRAAVRLKLLLAVTSR